MKKEMKLRFRSKLKDKVGMDTGIDNSSDNIENFFKCIDMVCDWDCIEQLINGKWIKVIL
jgi:hypothetical protein